MKAAAVQFAPVFKDLTANLDTMGQLAMEAAKAGAELIVFPELATTGYSFSSREEAQPFSEPLLAEKGPSPSLDHMTHISKGTGAAIAWGFVEDAQEKLFNSQCLVTPDGRYATYRKRNLWACDFWWATPGDVSPTIIEWKGRKIGLLVCRDIRDKSDAAAEIYEPGDADIVAFSSNFGNGPIPAVSWVEFAIDNRVTLVASNRYGDEEGDETYSNFGKGGICIIRPDGKCLREGLKLGAPCIVMADV